MDIFECFISIISYVLQLVLFADDTKKKYSGNILDQLLEGIDTEMSKI